MTDDHDDDDDDESAPPTDVWGAREQSPEDKAEGDGYMAAWGRSPRTAVPHSVASDEGRAWLVGWAAGAADMRQAGGQLAAASAIARNEVRRTAQTDRAYRPDPTAVLDEPMELTPAEAAIMVDAARLGGMALAEMGKALARLVESVIQTDWSWITKLDYRVPQPKQQQWPPSAS